MPYDPTADLDVEIGIKRAVVDTFHYAKQRHAKWTHAVANGEIVVFKVIDGESEVLRGRINRALRLRHIRATVQRAMTPAGEDVYVVQLKKP